MQTEPETEEDQERNEGPEQARLHENRHRSLQTGRDEGSRLHLPGPHQSTPWKNGLILLYINYNLIVDF